MSMTTQRKEHEQWLLELTAMPTAAGREQRIVTWVTEWVRRRRDLKLRADRAGNLLITQMPRSKSKAVGSARARRARGKPIFITAHMDHPAFVVRSVANDDTVELEFRGGVHDAYFQKASIDIFDERDRAHRARLITLEAAARPFKRVIAQLRQPSTTIKAGDVGRWAFDGQKVPRISSAPGIPGGILRTHACDDLAAVAAALATLDSLRGRRGTEHVGVLLTRAEEVGFIGAIAACKTRGIPKNARLICLENSRSFAESPIGAGPILRVGDKTSVFNPTLTNRISLILMEHQKNHPDFKWQRKLMPGGTCEATTFSTFGYQSTCICLPLGNYHNMVDIDAAASGKKPAAVGPEQISVSDYHGMIEMLVICAQQLDAANVQSIEQRMNQLFKEFGHVLA